MTEGSLTKAQRLGKALALFRLARGYSQTQAGGMVNATGSHLCSVETGRYGASPELLARLCDAYGISEHLLRSLADGAEDHEMGVAILRALRRGW